jgi:protein-tyrosine phosphatase
MAGNAYSRHLFAPVSSSPATLILIHLNDDFHGRSLMNPYWIKTDAFRLAIIPRPRGQDWLLDDIRFLQRAGVDVVVSALTASENEELGLVDERQCCQSSVVEFLSFPIEDRSVPSSFSEFKGLIRRVVEYLRSGKAVAVHCRAGIGRSSMIVVTALIQNGFSAESAFHAVEEARGCPVPDTPEQRQWVESHSSLFNSP